jgi:hypothetical protein
MLEAKLMPEVAARDQQQHIRIRPDQIKQKALCSLHYLQCFPRGFNDSLEPLYFS